MQKVREVLAKSLTIKILAAALLMAGIFFYFKTFFTKGVYFDDTFLKRESISLENMYTGKGKYGDIQIVVKKHADNQDVVDVIYKLPNNINRWYTVSFTGGNYLGKGIEYIKDENGIVVFQGGSYSMDTNFLMDKNNDPFMEKDISLIIQGENPYTTNYKIPLHNVASFAAFDNEAIRGSYKLLFIALLILMVTLVDIKFPLFLFTLRNITDVKNPEPSDFYLKMQRISWVVSPIVVVIIMIAAIW